MEIMILHVNDGGPIFYCHWKRSGGDSDNRITIFTVVVFPPYGEKLLNIHDLA